MKKRFLVIISVLITVIAMSFALVACGGNTDDDKTPKIIFSDASVELYVGQTAKIKPVAQNTSDTLLWQSSNANIAGVDQMGLVTAYRKGIAVITVFNRDATAEIIVTVGEPDEKPSISFASQTMSVSLYDYVTIVPILLKVDPDSLVWSSSDPTVATVTNGVLKQKSIGTTEISVASGVLSAKITVTVAETNKVPTVEYDRESLELLTGGTLDISPTVKFNGNVVLGAEVYMNTADDRIATVENGVVTGKAVGETFIVVDVSYRGYSFAAKYIPVSVKADADVWLSANKVDIYTRDIANYGYNKTATVTAAVYKNNVAESNAKVEWISNDNNIATVTDGTITAVGEGETKITAKCVMSDNTVVTSTVDVKVELPVITLNGIAERDLSKSEESVKFEIPDNLSDATLKSVVVNGENITASLEPDGISIGKNVLADHYGNVTLSVKLEDVVYNIPSLIITKSIASMDDLRSVAESAAGLDTFGGYFVLERDIIANNVDDFRIIDQWSNVGEKGFIGTFDGRGFGIYDLKIHEEGLFECLGASGTVKNLALVNANGSGFALATECRGLVDNVFVISNSKTALINMSDDAKLSGGFAVLSADKSNVVKEIFNSTCRITDFYALADNMIGYTSYSQGQEPTIAARNNVADLRTELSGLNFDRSGYNKEYWELKGGTPTFKSYIPNIPRLEITSPAEIICSAGQPIAISTTGFASVSLKTAVDGASSDGKTVTVDKNVKVTIVATGLFGETAEKQIDFIVAVFSDRTDTRLFDYELNAEALTFALPDDISTIDKLSFGNGVYFTATDGFSVSGGSVTVNKTIMSQAANRYGDGTVTLVSGDNYYNYSCSFVTKIITSYDDLKNLRTEGNTLDGYFVLDRDITANNEVPMPHLIATWSSQPDNGFTGIFDGRGHTVTGLKLTAYGMFGSLGRGTVRNIALVNVAVRERQDNEDAGIRKPTVFGSFDCQGATFRNVFVSTDADQMYGNNWNTVTLENVMFVSSKADAHIFNEGNDSNGGSLTLKNVAAVCADFYNYYGGTPVKDNAVKYDTATSMLSAFSADNKLAAWSNSIIVYSDGKILFNGKHVL